MRLFDAILDANHRAVNGDAQAGIHVADFASELPVVALTCIDPRLNRFFPGVMGLPEEHFIWLRNAGNIITSPVSSTMRSLALACAVKGAREIAMIGHTDCKVRHTSISQLIDAFRALGVERSKLPENLTDYFGVFASEQQNVIRGVDFIRQSPLIGPNIPVHGLMVCTDTGKLEWIVNGYEMLARNVTRPLPDAPLPGIGTLMGELNSRIGAQIGAIESAAGKIGSQLPGMSATADKIGQAAANTGKWLSEIKVAPPAGPAPAAAAAPPPPLPAPPPPPVPPAVRPPRPPPIPPRIEPPPKSGSPRYRV